MLLCNIYEAKNYKPHFHIGQNKITLVRAIWSNKCRSTQFKLCIRQLAISPFLVKTL